MLVLVIVVLFCEEAAKAFSAETRRARATRQRVQGGRFVAAVVGVSALATAVINLVAAVVWKH
ncbi:MAG: hypothetical protein WB383_06020 [Acidimicrobiales bacterium]